MPFPTMSKENVKLRVALRSFKNEDLKELIEDQTAVPNSYREATGAAKAARLLLDKGLKNAYVKIGLVKKSLVFRIKHDGGHFGEDDVVLVKVYVEPKPEELIQPKKTSILGDTGVLKLGSGKPELSSAWWEKVTGDGFEDSTFLTQLSELDRRKDIAAKTPSSAAIEAVGFALLPVRKSVIRIARLMVAKDDRKAMVRLLEQASDARAQLETDLQAYGERVKAARAEVITDQRAILKKAQDTIVLLSNSIKKGEDQDKVGRAFARAVSALEYVVGYSFKQIVDVATNAAPNHRVQVGDMDLESLRPMVGEAQRKGERYAADLEKLDEKIQEGQVELPRQLGLDEPSPNMQAGKLREAYEGYLSALDTCKQGTVALKLQGTRAGRLAELGPEALGDEIDAIMVEVVDRRTISKQAIENTRNTGSKFTKMKVEAGVTKALDERYFIPAINLIIAEAARQRRVMASLRGVVEGAVERVPEKDRERVRKIVAESFREAL